MKGDNESDAGAAQASEDNRLDAAQPPEAEKAEIVSAFVNMNAPALEQGQLRPPDYKVVPASEAAAAHRMMQASGASERIILKF